MHDKETRIAVAAVVKPKRQPCEKTASTWRVHPEAPAREDRGEVGRFESRVHVAEPHPNSPGQHAILLEHEYGGGTHANS